jgi:hypothetical protein
LSAPSFLTFNNTVGEFKVPCEDSPSFENFYEQYKEKQKEEKEKKERKKAEKEAEEEAEKDLSALDPVVCPWPLEPNTKHNVGDPPCQLVCPQGNVYSKTEWVSGFFPSFSLLATSVFLSFSL